MAAWEGNGGPEGAGRVERGGELRVKGEEKGQRELTMESYFVMPLCWEWFDQRWDVFGLSVHLILAKVMIFKLLHLVCMNCSGVVLRPHHWLFSD